MPRRRPALWAGAAVLVLGAALAAWVWRGSAPTLPSSLGKVAPAQAAPAPLPQPIATADPEGASYDELLQGASSDWRVARLALNPKILVIEFPTLTEQALALNRLAALIEKHRAPRDRVLGDEALARLIRDSGDTPETFYFGHDYPAEAVARFFTLAVNQQVLLNAQELRLGNLLLFSKVLKEQNDRLVAAEDRRAVVTFTAVQRDNQATRADETVDARRREAILRHELSHGEFFTNAAYRKHCWSFWQGLSDEDRKLFRAFLVKQDYDPTNEELMVNETQAFLMHTPDPRAFDAAMLGTSQARVDALRAQFAVGMPESIFTKIGKR
jgi:hypothetical protein